MRDPLDNFLWLRLQGNDGNFFLLIRIPRRYRLYSSLPRRRFFLARHVTQSAPGLRDVTSQGTSALEACYTPIAAILHSAVWAVILAKLATMKALLQEVSRLVREIVGCAHITVAVDSKSIAFFHRAFLLDSVSLDCSPDSEPAVTLFDLLKSMKKYNKVLLRIKGFFFCFARELVARTASTVFTCLFEYNYR